MAFIRDKKTGKTLWLPAAALAAHESHLKAQADKADQHKKEAARKIAHTKQKGK